MTELTMTKSELAKFLQNIDRQSNGCWLWTKGKGSRGYGAFIVGGKQQKTHRLSYANFIGPIPKGYFVDHACHNRSCVAPHHLRLATPKQNAENRNGATKENKSSGIRGVYFDKSSGMWQAKLRHNGKTIAKRFPDSSRGLADASSWIEQKRQEIFSHNPLDQSN